MTDRNALEIAVEKKKRQLRENKEDIGDYSDSDDEEDMEEIGDWLDEGTLDGLVDMKNSTTEKKPLPRKLSTQKSYFDQFPVGIRDTVIKALEKESFEAGDTIVSQGDEGDCMYMILDGEASISVRDEESGKERLITHIYKPHLRNLITKILTKNPKRRPTLRSLMSHEWITAEGCEPMSPTVFN